jgi:hypothetical protein
MDTGHRQIRGKTMKRLVQIVLISATLGISGCAEPGHYPVSGEDCKPNDPVKDLNAADCIVPPT